MITKSTALNDKFLFAATVLMLWQSFDRSITQAKFAIVSTSFTSCRKKKTATYMNSAVCFTTMTMSHIYCSNLEQEHPSEIAETVFSSRNFGVKFKENGRITPRIYNKPVWAIYWRVAEAALYITGGDSSNKGCFGRKTNLFRESGDFPGKRETWEIFRKI